MTRCHPSMSPTMRREEAPVRKFRGFRDFCAECATMADDTPPVLQIRHSDGQDWFVAATWPDGRCEEIGGFKNEAKQTNGSPTNSKPGSITRSRR